MDAAALQIWIYNSFFSYSSHFCCPTKNQSQYQMIQATNHKLINNEKRVLAVYKLTCGMACIPINCPLNSYEEN